MENNARIAVLLRQIAALLEEQGVAFKPAAYRRAAKVLDELTRDVSDFKDVKELEALPGIGESIAKKIQEYLKTGRIAALDKLLGMQGGIPPALMEVEGLGPKRARQLQMALGIQTIADLMKAAEAGKLNGLPGFSETMQQKILENAKRVSERVRRFPREEVKDDVAALLKKIRGVEGIEQCEVAGSFRREKETVGDIDVLVVTKSAKNVSDAIAELSIVRDVVAHGDKKLSFDLQSGIRVDIRFVKRDQWGAALLYFTGSKEHNIALRKRAIQRGWKLNEYGLFEGEKIIASREEEDIYKALSLPFVEPLKRTDVLP
ncbi:MAG: type-X family DNA polymerase [Candidatus Peribacteraceae bacterium]|nr:type-X family DNA polymerase [Candidatus Peribacteraceae bacterium]MDD5739500.1 type-X family DNA polymerase [Candidatus Peribacteraceae bacterium]